jgi:L-threonylcarbamoyladenylate synthase
LRKILRPGGVTLEKLQHYLNDITIFTKETDNENLVENPPTPGMKYRHYSPSVEVILLIGNNEEKMKEIIESKFVCHSKTIIDIQTLN